MTFTAEFLAEESVPEFVEDFGEAQRDAQQQPVFGTKGVMGKNKTEEFAKKNDVAGVMIIDGDRGNYKVYKSPGFKSIQEAN